MAFRERIKVDADATTLHKGTGVSGKATALARRMKNGLWRVYEDGTAYNSNSGQVIECGKVMRDTAGDPVQFRTLAEAEEWFRTGSLIFKDGKDVEFAKASRVMV